ncbi:MAG: hypothetical protein ABL901_01095 [Hyphomicrobiaceae bacterium]
MAGQDIGSNAAAELKRRVDRRVEKLDVIAEHMDELKEMKAEDKSDGFTEAAIMDSVKLRRADADKVLATLTLEAEKDVYRRANGIPTDLDAASAAASAEAQSVPDPKAKRGKREAYRD